jgi:hypothetical protein
MKPVYIYRKKYNSVAEAAVELGLARFVIVARVRSKSELWKDWSNDVPKRKVKKKTE